MICLSQAAMARLEHLTEVACLLLSWGNVSDRPQEPPMVVPVDPFEGGELVGLGPPMMDSAEALS